MWNCPPNCQITGHSFPALVRALQSSATAVEPSHGEKTLGYLCLCLLIPMPSTLKNLFSPWSCSLWRQTKTMGKSPCFSFTVILQFMTWWYQRLSKNEYIRKAKNCHRIMYLRSQNSTPEFYIWRKYLQATQSNILLLWRFFSFWEFSPGAVSVIFELLTCRYEIMWKVHVRLVIEEGKCI